MKTAYPIDRRDALEVMDSGLVRVELEKQHGCSFGGVCTVPNPEFQSDKKLRF